MGYYHVKMFNVLVIGIDNYRLLPWLLQFFLISHSSCRNRVIRIAKRIIKFNVINRLIWPVKNKNAGTKLGNKKCVFTFCKVWDL